MFKALRRQPWTCARCLRQQQRRASSSPAWAVQPDDPGHAPSHIFDGLSGAEQEDFMLRQVFDHNEFWRSFNKRIGSSSSSPWASAEQKQGSSGGPKGLFLNRYLTSPDGFRQYAQASLQKCQKLVGKILCAQTVDELKSIAKDLDRLSDLLCRVIDLSDFVRSTHPDRNIQNAATQAYSIMFEYMNQLNTTTGLNDQLRRALASQEVVSSWSEEEKIAAQILERDFSKSAIELPDGERNKFVDLSNDIAQVGTEFVDTMEPAKRSLNFASSDLNGMDPMVVKKFTKYGQTTLPTAGYPAQLALRTVEDPDVRREIYIAHRSPKQQSIDLVESLLHSRAELAKLSGYPSYAHMALTDKMAKSPEAVKQFLFALSRDNRRLVQSELQELLELKESDALSGNFPKELNAWDRDYYASRMLSTLHTRMRSSDFLSAYFSMGAVMQGFNRLFHRLYDVRLVPRPTEPGETWHPEVRRLDVMAGPTSSPNLIAVMYCDLYARQGKSPNPAHFTLRCSREISTHEVAESAATPHPFPSDLEAAVDGMAHHFDLETRTLSQLPTIALICDFARPPQHTQRPTLLTFREVQTLFHEMGHALHSILGRTKLQNVSGTRCATDFAELPSVLMEHFAASPAVLNLFARHWSTDEPLPFGAVKERLELDRRTRGAEIEAQILLSLLDQEYHGPGILNGRLDSTKVYQDIWSAHSSVPEPQGTAYQGFFGHLYGYGATYYSYLFDRAIAGKVWRDVFDRTAESSVDRKAGERFRDEVLKWGGSRDGWKCVAGLLGDARLENGGEEAMKIVGEWGVHA